MSEYAVPWADEPSNKDYLAAYDLLGLLWGSRRAEESVALLRAAPVIDLPAANVCWAAGFDPLPLHDPGVRHEIARLAAGRPRRPVLLARFDGGVVIADGHHRLALSYQRDPFAPVRCKLA